jgi:hypothetical protein
MSVARLSRGEILEAVSVGRIESHAPRPIPPKSFSMILIPDQAGGYFSMDSRSVAGILGAIVASIVLVIAIVYGPIGQFGKPAKPAKPTIVQPPAAAPAPRGPVVREVPN